MTWSEQFSEKFRYIFKGDRILWNSILVLAGLSVVAVYSAIGALAYQQFDGNTTYVMLKHLLFVLLGLVAALIFQFVPYKIYFKHAFTFFAIAFVLVILTRFIGVEINGARRWLAIPLTGIAFQPSELLKIGLLMVTARILSVNQNSDQGMALSFYAITGIAVVSSVALISQGLSTSLLAFLIVVVLMFIGRMPIKYIASIIVVALLGLGVIFVILKNSPEDIKRGGTWISRVDSFINGDKASNSQAREAKIAIATGGIIGKGPGNSVQRSVLSQSYSDFIFASFVEEYGLMGALVIIALYLWILYRGINTVNHIRNSFPALLALGLIFAICIQAFANMAIAVGLGPVTGQTLPFMSMGGTSIVITGAAFGIILNVSREAVINAKEMNEQKFQNTETIQNIESEQVV
jgi:cell division protein FtsW